MSELLKALEALGKSVHALDNSPVGPWLWLAWFLAALLWSAQRLRRHMEHGKVTASGQTLGHRTVGLDHSGASLFRSSWRTERRPSISPFYGRPAILRMLPYPLAVAYLYLLLHHTLVTGALTAAGAAWGFRRVHLWGKTYRHRRAIVRPMAQALGPALGERPDVILTGTIVPRQWERPDATVVIPLPDDHRPEHVNQAVRIVHERLGGEWKSVKSKQSPYFITLSHKPAPPTYVTVQDVAHLVLENDTPKKLLLGLGCSSEPVWGSFQKDAPHMALSCGTQGGKSTLNRWILTQFALQGARQICIDVKYTSFKGCANIPGVRIYNDPERLDIMWAAIHLVAEERKRRARTRQWDYPIVLHLEEQNQMANMINQWWEKITNIPGRIEEICAENPVIREVLQDEYGGHIPKICPVWSDIQDLLFMGGEFEVHLNSTYQRMIAAAVGGGKAGDGGALRDQYGVKMLANFSRSAWDSVVQTRPIPEAPSVKGRWIQARMRGGNREIQVPNCGEDDPIWLLKEAGLELSPVSVPDPLTLSFHEIPGSVGDWGTGTAAPAGAELPDNVKPFRARAEVLPEELPEPRYTLEEACSKGIISMAYETAKKARQRAESGEFPAGQKDGRATTYTAEELREWQAEYEAKRTGNG